MPSSPRSLSFVLLFVSLASAGCFSIPQPDAADEQLAALPRLSHDFFVESSGEEQDRRTVVARQGGEPSAPRRIIYVHGTPGDATAWADFLIEPIDGTESVALDRPGFGESDRRALPPLADQVRAIEPFLTEGADGWPILVGHSLGGPIIALAAAEYPERVGGIVIIAGSLDPGLEKRRWYNYVAPLFYWMIPQALVRANQEIWPLRGDLEELEERLDEVTCPVLIIHGREDDLVPFANVPFMTERFTAASSVEVLPFDDVGHFLIWVEPWESEIRAALERFRRPTE